MLKQYIQIYPKLFDYLKLFKVKPAAIESHKNESKLMIYQNRLKPVNPDVISTSTK